MGEAGRKLVWDEGVFSPSGWPRPPRRSTASGWRSAANEHAQRAQRAGADVPPRDAGRRHDRRHARTCSRTRSRAWRAPATSRCRPISSPPAWPARRARAFGADHLRRRLPEQLGPRASGAGAPRHARRPVHHHRLDRRWPVRPHAGQGGAARHAGPRRLQAAGRRRPRRRGHAALERDRGHARRRHLRIPFPYPHAHALGQGMRRRRPGQAPASPTSCGCRARRWPAAWAASATTCWPQGYFDADYVAAAREAGFRHLYTTDPFGQNTPGADPEHIYRFAVRNRGGSWLNRRIWLSRDPFWGPRYHAWKAWKKRLRNRG